MGKKEFKKLSDEELREKIVQAENREIKQKSLGINGVILGAIGCILGMLLEAPILTAIFAVVFLVGFIFYFIGHRTESETVSFVDEQMSDFYEAEWKKTFGPRMNTQEMRISKPLMEELHPVKELWEYCNTWRSYEGNYHGTHFSVANVKLVEEILEGDNGHKQITRYRGMVLRCKDICDPALDITLREKGTSKRESDLTNPVVFCQFFSASTADGQPVDYLVTPELRELVRKLKACDNRELVDLELRRLKNLRPKAQEVDKVGKKTHVIEDSVLENIRKQEELAQNLPVTALALHDGEAILAINGCLIGEGILEGDGMTNIDLIRSRFRASMPLVCNLIDILRESFGK